MSDNKYLKLARAAREEGNSEEAKRFYDMVRTDDPENGEAKFFYQVYSLYEGRNVELPSKFVKITRVLDSSIKYISISDDTEEEKLKIVKDIVLNYTTMPWSLNKYMARINTGDRDQKIFSNKDYDNIRKEGVLGLYNLGDAIADYFPNNSEAIKQATTSWKEGVSLQQKWTFIDYGRSVDVYISKIKEVDPSYQPPEKSGCISFPNLR